MPSTYMPPDQVEAFRAASAACGRASGELHTAIMALLPLAEPGTPAEAALRLLEQVEDALRGKAYGLAPQTEWMGGDPSEAKNFKTRWPHDVRGVGEGWTPRP